ncbi:hypothetical protein NDN08_007227 [Rhodosorus marinus]|uniref:C2H2-type domain-containing protein n=1 Tax=Rhodosorus marinus TaxID=101924 RepID=A0AAV8UIV5_9RHOD|nr:hypothetical protein NDN08_007227 [Rhodosorus marinus]
MESLGTQFSSLSPHLEWDSIPMNWSLFRLHRQAVPYPGDWSVMLIDMRFKIPELTESVINASVSARMISLFTQPSLMMTEVHCDSYILGSGWTFLGGLPDLDGLSNGRHAGMQRIRFLSWLENNKARALLSSEVRPGLIVFAKISELDGRYNQTTWGLVGQDDETVLHTHVHLERRTCDVCRTIGKPCDDRICKFEQSFHEMRDARISLLEQMTTRSVNMQYTMAWLAGSFTIPCGPLEPMTVDTSCYISGSNFDRALLAVLQSEVSSVHPPRSSFRFVKLVKDEVDGLLDTEVYFSAAEDQFLTFPADCASSSGEGSGHKQVSTSASEPLEPRSTAKKHVCDDCGASYGRAYHLKRHWTVVHQKRRDYLCSACDRTFTQSGHLNEHVRVAHRTENLFQCSRCDKSFGTSSKLTRHTLTVHENRRRFECDVCMKRYKEKSYLKQHLRSQHGVQMEA